MSNIQKYSPDQIQKFRQMCGMGDGRRLYIPMIKLNYGKVESGKIQDFVVENENNEWELLGDSFDGTIVLVTRQLRAWNEKDECTDIRSNEFTDYAKPIKLIFSDSSEKVFVNYREAKEYNDRLKLYVNVYVYVHSLNKVRRLMVKGASLSNFFDHEGAFGPQEVFFGVKTSFSTGIEKNKATEYYPIKFTKGEANADLDFFFQVNQDTLRALMLVVESYQDKNVGDLSKEELNEILNN